MAHSLLTLAREVLQFHLQGRDWRQNCDLSGAVAARGCFVSLKDAQGLRGCIGTVTPLRKSLEQEVGANAVAAATRDPRFSPVGLAELPGVRFSIDLLSLLEPVTDPNTLDSSRYGVVVRNGAQQGVLLPDLPGVTTWQEQLSICRDKAGIPPEADISLHRFTVERMSE